MKPKYSFFSNTKYALAGLKAMLGETSFRIEISIILPLLIIAFLLPVSLQTHLLLIVVLIGVLIAECINTAVEACVDLITRDFHHLAKIAKDTASAAVFLSISSALIVWISVILSLL